jgi:hypothetical protein
VPTPRLGGAFVKLSQLIGQTDTIAARGVSEIYGHLLAMKNRNVLALVLALAAASSALAVDPDYSAILTTNLTSITTIWSSVATVIIGVALVTVGVRFFRKAK